jgi:hypothetical protein
MKLNGSAPVHENHPKGIIETEERETGTYRMGQSTISWGLSDGSVIWGSRKTKWIPTG